MNIDLLVIDEAQIIPDIGLILKLIVDSIPGMKVITTGSSVFDLNNNLGEPLVGRKNTLYLFLVSQIEFAPYENYKQTCDNLEQRLLFGGYLELEQYVDWENKKEYLYEIINYYPLKNILFYDGIKHSNKIYVLLRLIAYQLAKEASLQELATQLQMSKIRLQTI